MTSEATRDLTHVIVFGDNRGESEWESVEGREKIKWARRMNMTRKKKSAGSPQPIQIVWEEWFWDSIALKGVCPDTIYVELVIDTILGRCNEETYDVTQPRPTRDGTSSEQATLPKARDVTTDESHPKAPLGSWPTPSMLSSHSSTPVPVVRPHHPYRSSSMDPTSIARVNAPEKPSDSPVFRDKGKGRASPARYLSAGETRQKGSTKKATSSVHSSQADPNAATSTPLMSTASTNSTKRSRPTNEPPALFAGMHFRVLGDAESPALLGALRDACGTIITSSTSSGKTTEVDFIVVRLARSVTL